MGVMLMDSEAARALIEEWDGPIYRLAYRWLGDHADAADASQEIFLVLLRDLPQLREPSKRGRWIMTAARRVLARFKDRRRKRRFREQAPTDIEPETDEASPEQRDRALVVRDSVAALPEELRSAIELHFFMGLSQREAAAALDLPRSTVQTRINTALNRLRPGLASGAAAAAPDIGAWLRGPEISPPPSLRARLLSKLGEPSALTTLAKGDIIMKLKTGASIVLITGLSVLGGFAAGELTAAAPARGPSIITEQEPPPAEASPDESTPGESAAEDAEQARELRQESADLKARLTAVQKGIEELERAALASAEPAPSAPEKAAPETRGEDAFYALAGDVIAVFGEIDKAASKAEAQAAFRSFLRSHPNFNRVVVQDSQALDFAIARRIAAGDPPLDTGHHLACVGEVLKGRLNEATRRVIFDHMASVIEAASEPMELRSKMIARYATDDPGKAPARFRELVEVSSRLDDPALFQSAARVLEELGRRAQDEARALFRDSKTSQRLRAAALLSLEDSRLPALSEQIFEAAANENAALRAAALARLSGLPRSPRARRILEQRIDEGGLSELEQARGSLIKHADRATVDKLSSIANDARRSEEARAQAAGLMARVLQGQKVQEEGR